MAGITWEQCASLPLPCQPCSHAFGHRGAQPQVAERVQEAVVQLLRPHEAGLALQVLLLLLPKLLLVVGGGGMQGLCIGEQGRGRASWRQRAANSSGHVRPRKGHK